MCGIAGLVLTPPQPIGCDLIRTSLQRLEHRGPDDFGWLAFHQKQVQLGRQIDEDVVAEVLLLHRRLSILDLSEAGWQPMGTPDGRYYLVFNGEIYNYLELRVELESLGHNFCSRSDTEVLLAAYVQWGAQALPRLVGMFALAILDTQARKLFLARDFFGIKPLYYAFTPQGFAFASEIKALLDFSGVSRQVNPRQLYLYLRYALTDHGIDTLLADVKQLPAAHYLEIELARPDKAQPVCYWQIDLSQKTELSFEQATARLRELFLKSVGLHLRSDVPVGAALSGGIDSAAIVTAMHYLQGVDLELHTFSYTASDPAISEERWVDLAGHTAKAVVHKVQPTPQELATDLAHLIYTQDEPFGSTTIYAQHRVFQLAHEAGIKVMLDGQGADEILGGYIYYLAARLASLIRQGRWSETVRFLDKAAKLPGTGKLWLLLKGAEYLLPPSWQGPARQLLGKDMVPAWLNKTWFDEHDVTPTVLNYTSGEEVLREHLVQTLTETSLPHLLRYEDRNSMAFSIESRVPFLTPKLVNFMLSLPEEYIIAPDGTTKAVFRQAMRGIVPDAILDRRDKIGFATPEQDWLTTLRPWVERILPTEATATIPALNAKAIKQEWRLVVEGRKPFGFHVWCWINLIEWTRRFEIQFENG